MTIDQINKIKSIIQNVNFKIISDEEIQKLSILQILNPISFNENGETNENSLYDLRLGSLKKDVLCKTCQSSYFDCDGHYGHIKLPLPVINPFFFKTVCQILDLICTSCYKMLTKPIEKNILQLQLDLLNYNLDYLSNYVTELTNDLINVDLTNSEILKKFEDKISEAKILDILNDYKKNETNEKNNRIKIEKKQILIRDFLKKRKMGFIKNCTYCNSKRKNYIVNGSSIYVNVKDTNEKNVFESILKNKIRENVEDGKKLINVLYLRLMFRKFWSNENEFLNQIIPFYDFELNKYLENHEKICDLDYKINNVLDYDEELYGKKCPLDIFFKEYVLVTPSRFRPLRFIDDRQFEHSKSSRLSNIILISNQLSNIYNTLINNDTFKDELNLDLSKPKKKLISTNSNKAKFMKIDSVNKLFYKFWIDLQNEIFYLLDSEANFNMYLNKNRGPGIKQLLEKKEGLFRKNIMGKRVNYAARSVISPDPYIMVDEIGFPEIFAKRLSFPEPVNDHNYEILKKLVLNGPDIYPGALSVQMENGSLIRLSPTDKKQRESVAYNVTCNSYSKNNPDLKIKIVNRHLHDGDILLINRQPTLHKPSIMAHKARVLPAEKTIRLHYANCKCYNADFDGDEMNAHFPQSYLTRAEGLNIVSVNYQYLVPKDGTPLSGLIQDHIISATLLTYRGEFFVKKDYQNLVYNAILFKNKPIQFLKPAILKPKTLWTGKQIASTIILNLIPENSYPLSLQISSKIKPSILISQKPREFTVGGKIKINELCDSQVVIRKGEIMTGLIDKSNLGNTSYSLVHAFYELYGGKTSSEILTAFARLANTYLQTKCGFTLGIYDILVTKKADKNRHKIIEESKKLGDLCVMDAFNILNKNEEVILNELQFAHHSSNSIYMKMLDSSAKSMTNEINNKISKECLPNGLLKPFPYNHLQMMIQAGSKGGLVNALQISCLLGQIELEGKRVPLMISGKTLPSFKSYDTSLKAGGFITSRFLTGLRPQEFFFHCMAGREGLIDTAVKTSRSGYLQRCLIKHLEGLVVNYDNTVRDSDQSVIQFFYGEDGLDILKSQLLKSKGLSLIAQNSEILLPDKKLIKEIKSIKNNERVDEQFESIKDWEIVNGRDHLIRKRGTAFPQFFKENLKEINVNCDKETKDLIYKEIYNSWYKLSKDDRLILNKYTSNCPDPVYSKVNPSKNFGVLSEKMEELMNNYLKYNPDKFLIKKKNAKSSLTLHCATNKNFSKIINYQFMKSMCEPGEAVGLLAAQSIGEPSTQMTLNTFHFAGRGEMNVTLGIPRLREIIMKASASISTPSMDISFRKDIDIKELEKIADKVRIQLSSCYLSNVLEYVEIVEKCVVNPEKCCQLFEIKFKYLKRKYYKDKYFTDPSKILQSFETKFIKNLIKVIKKKIDALKNYNVLIDVTKNLSRESKKTNEDENIGNPELTNTINEDDETSSDEENGDGDADDAKNKGSRNQDLTYEEPEDVELEKSSSENEDDNLKEEINDISFYNEDKSPDNEFNINKSFNIDKNKNVKIKKISQASKHDRIHLVKSISTLIVDYDFDEYKEEWNKLTLEFNLFETKIDLLSIIQDEVNKTVLHKVDKIEKVFLVQNPNFKPNEFDKILKTEGVSFLSLIKFSNYLDLNSVYSNNIHSIANTYGIEAGRQAIVLEMKNVFGVYGIEIDPRHLSLIADYMTFSGTIRGMNRMSMISNSSPIQQITFETSINFLKNATFLGVKDELNSPSARLFIGKQINVGSGMLDCIFDYKKSLENQVLSNVFKENKKRKLVNIKKGYKKLKTLDL